MHTFTSGGLCISGVPRTRAQARSKQPCTASKAAACGSGIPPGHSFKSWLLHFNLASRKCAWEKRQMAWCRVEGGPPWGRKSVALGANSIPISRLQTLPDLGGSAPVPPGRPPKLGIASWISRPARRTRRRQGWGRRPRSARQLEGEDHGGQQLSKGVWGREGTKSRCSHRHPARPEPCTPFSAVLADTVSSAHCASQRCRPRRVWGLLHLSSDSEKKNSLFFFLIGNAATCVFSHHRKKKIRTNHSDSSKHQLPARPAGREGWGRDWAVAEGHPRVPVGPVQCLAALT